MRSVKLLFTVVAVALFALACGDGASTNQTANTANTTNTNQPPANTNSSQASPSPADPMTSARAIYAAECARCHGINGDGGTVTVLKKKLKVPSLKMGHALDHTEEQLAKQIRDGGDGMPAFKDQLKPEEINILVQLIRKEIQGGAAKK
jgi:mono/diheme cytochrome c family protein